MADERSLERLDRELQTSKLETAPGEKFVFLGLSTEKFQREALKAYERLQEFEREICRAFNLPAHVLHLPAHDSIKALLARHPQELNLSPFACDVARSTREAIR